MTGDQPAERWYARPVIGVTDLARAAGFYIDGLGFSRDWDYAEEGRLLIVQVSRGGCELILSSQWPERVGRGLIFISLTPAYFDRVRGELDRRGMPVRPGWWGCPLMVVEDPDGNTLYFPEDSSGEVAA